jgi:hypothetical protein
VNRRPARPSARAKRRRSICSCNRADRGARAPRPMRHIA